MKRTQESTSALLVGVRNIVSLGSSESHRAGAEQRLDRESKTSLRSRRRLGCIAVSDRGLLYYDEVSETMPSIRSSDLIGGMIILLAILSTIIVGIAILR